LWTQRQKSSRRQWKAEKIMRNLLFSFAKPGNASDQSRTSVYNANSAILPFAAVFPFPFLLFIRPYLPTAT
jgi:hypothetical protein